MSQIRRPVVISIAGPPGAGKTTIAAQVFAGLKEQGEIVELVTEPVKLLVWQKRFAEIASQYTMSLDYAKALRAFDGSAVEYVVTDSCLLTGICHLHEEQCMSDPAKTEQKIVEWFGEMDNRVFFVEHGNHPYQTEGRMETPEGALEIQKDLKQILGKHGVAYTVVKSAEEILMCLVD